MSQQQEDILNAEAATNFLAMFDNSLFESPAPPDADDDADEEEHVVPAIVDTEKMLYEQRIKNLEDQVKNQKVLLDQLQYVTMQQTDGCGDSGEPPAKKQKRSYKRRSEGQTPLNAYIAANLNDKKMMAELRSGVGLPEKDEDIPKCLMRSYLYMRFKNESV